MAVRMLHSSSPYRTATNDYGKYARTDPSVTVQYPEEGELPSSKIQGRGGQKNMRTLPSFSLEGKVAVVTGGARGLGLVMAQALVISGADVALVDLNGWFSGEDLARNAG